MGIGAICLLLSAVLSLQITISDSRLSDTDRMASITAVWYQNHHVLINVLHDIGFAALIALLIFILVERASRLEQRHSADDFIHRISTNVLEAAYGIKSDPDIVRHVITNILAAPVIRSGMRQTFTLESFPTDKAIAGYIIMRVASFYELKNVSGGTVEWPIRVFLPKTKYPELDELVYVVACSIDERALNQGEINDALKVNENYEKCYSWDCTMSADKTANVAITYQVVKEISDNESWTTLLTTRNSEVVIDNRIPGIYWSLNPRTSARIIPVDAPTRRPWGEVRILFRIVDPMLAHQGFTIWWQPQPVSIQVDGAALEAIGPSVSDESDDKHRP